MSISIDESLSDDATLQELGARLGRWRIEAQLTQAQLAERAGVSKSTVARLEAGTCYDLRSLIRVLRPLGRAAGWEGLLPALGASPLDQLKLRGKTRQRVRHGQKAKTEATGTWRWGDER